MIDPRHGTGALLVLASLAGCGGKQAESTQPATAAARRPVAPTVAPPLPRATEAQQAQRKQAGEALPQKDDPAPTDDAMLVVSRDVVARCPTLRLVRAHVQEFDPEIVWLAVLESIADCMADGGPMEGISIGVSGDEEHRHVVREVLGQRGVAAARVVAAPSSAPGVAECQGADCDKRVEITLIRASAPAPK